MVSKKCLIGSWDDMPQMLTPQDIMRLGFSKQIVYRCFHRPDFPRIKISGAFTVDKNKFMKWLDKNTNSYDKRYVD